MKAKTRFLKMFYRLPVQARTELVFDFTGKCMTLNVCGHEIAYDTELGKRILLQLGYKDD